MSGSFQDVVLQTVVPTLGVITGTLMSLAPFRAVLNASRKGTLEDLNPTPWVFMLGNSCGWLAYSFLTKNMYVFVPNAIGFILAIWLNMQAIKLQYENFRSLELQTAMIRALEDLDRSKYRTVNKQAVTELVEQVIVEDAPSIEMIDPQKTAPVEDAQEMEAKRHRRNSSALNGEFLQRVFGVEGDLDHGEDKTATTYNSISASIPDDAGSSHSSLTNDQDIGTVQEAAEVLVDYASFVWDIAAQKEPAPASHELLVLAMSTLWLFLIALVALCTSHDLAPMIGYAVNANLIFFYGAPLSKIAQVLETRSSKWIHVPTMFTSLLNGTLWFLYGLAVHDGIIAIPNGLGAALGLVQLGLVLSFPRHSVEYSYTKDGAEHLPQRSTSSLSLPVESTPLI